MALKSNFPYLDYRSKMPRAKWSIGTRSITRYFTLHWNGPAVKAFGNPQGEIAQLQFDAQWHMRPGGVGAVNGADGIQYHGATLSNGLNIQLRDWSAKLWHCGNEVGNLQSPAWHLPIGKGQQPTQAQLDQVFGVVIPAFQREYHFTHVNVLGHQEWKLTDCPGTLMIHLMNWRETRDTVLPITWYKTLANVFVRETPEIKPNKANVALKGTALIPKGTVFAVNAVVNGKSHNGIDKYVHRADGLGFMLNDPQLLEKLV